MEYLCKHCGNSYLPKRTDSLYCSHTCRQEAYILRKLQLGITLSGSANETDSVNLSVRTDKSSVNEGPESDVKNGLSVKKEELSVRTDKLAVNLPDYENNYPPV